MTHVEYPQLESGPMPYQPELATYFIDVAPEFTEGYIALVYRRSDCPGFGGGIEEPEDEDILVFPIGIEEDEDSIRPADAPLRVRKVLPFLEPRWNESYVAFIIPVPEED